MRRRSGDGREGAAKVSPGALGAIRAGKREDTARARVALDYR